MIRFKEFLQERTIKVEIGFQKNTRHPVIIFENPNNIQIKNMVQKDINHSRLSLSGNPITSVRVMRVDKKWYAWPASQAIHLHVFDELFPFNLDKPKHHPDVSFEVQVDLKNNNYKVAVFPEHSYTSEVENDPLWKRMWKGMNRVEKHI